MCAVQDGEVLVMGGGENLLSTGDGVRGVEEEEEEDEDVPIFEKHNVILHGQNKMEKFVSSRFMKKYIHVARALKVPPLPLPRTPGGRGAPPPPPRARAGGDGADRSAGGDT